MSQTIDSVALLQSLIRFASVSSTSNDEIAEFIAAILQRLGFSVSRSQYVDSLGNAKVNLIASRVPAGQGGTAGGLAYFCHTDVVPATTWSGPGAAFESAIDGDRIYGRGSCDMKGSLVAMLAAISQVDLRSLAAPLHVICTADEEIGFIGAKHLVAESAEYRELVRSQPVAIIGEPTGCEVVHAHKGITVFRIISRGRAAHSSTRDGLNANLAMVPLLNELLRLHRLSESDSSLQDSRFDPPTLSWNFGCSDGVRAANIVPARSEAWVSLRPMPGIDGESLVAAAATKAAELGLEFRHDKGGRHVWVDPDAPAVRAMCEIAGVAAAKTVCYATDGGELGELAQRVVCGPGNIAQAHTDDEYITTGQLRRGEEIYLRAIQRWCL